MEAGLSQRPLDILLGSPTWREAHYEIDGCPTQREAMLYTTRMPDAAGGLVLRHKYTGKPDSAGDPLGIHGTPDQAGCTDIYMRSNSDLVSQRMETSNLELTWQMIDGSVTDCMLPETIL